MRFKNLGDLYTPYLSNSYIAGTRLVSDLLHWSPRAGGPRAPCNKSDTDRVSAI